MRDPRCSPVQSALTCDGLTIDAPGDGRRGDTFSLTVQADSFTRTVKLTDWLLHPVGGRCRTQHCLVMDTALLGLADVAMLTFYSHSEEVCGEAVAVPCLALVLAVIIQAYVPEVEPAVVPVWLPTGFLQTPILLLPLHLGRGSVEMKHECNER